MSKSLIQALMAMHKEFGVIIRKDSKGHKGTYASLPTILDQIHHMTSKHGIVLWQKPYVENGIQYLKTIIEHSESNERGTCESILTINPHAPDLNQAYGASMTYHRRYDAMAICGLFCEDDASDNDGWTPQAKEASDIHIEKSSDSPYISEAQVRKLWVVLKGKDEMKAKIVAHYGSLEQVPRERMNDLLKKIETEQ